MTYSYSTEEGSDIGYFITEPINYAGNVQLTFKMGTSENSGKLQSSES